MKFKDMEMLKYLAKKGATKQYITITTRACAQDLEISQQSASRKILNLEKFGYIHRTFGIRAQKIHITAKGIEVLRKAFAEYLTIFEVQNIIELEGLVVSGMGEGHYYMKEKRYRDQIVKKLHLSPYPGTLNIKILSDYLSRLEMIKAMPNIIISGFKTKDRTFGDVICYPAEMYSIKCALILPVRTHYTDIVEIISEQKLRSALNLKDGMRVKITVML